MSRPPVASDPFHLQRFVDAQRDVYRQVESELRAGQKRSHWMWFIFPQEKGLGRSEMAQRFAISSTGEAKAYLEHPVLGPRLRACTRLVTAIQGKTIEGIFGYPDHLKFRSSMRLFAGVTTDNRIFLDALEKFFGGDGDRGTVERV